MRLSIYILVALAVTGSAIWGLRKASAPSAGREEGEALKEPQVAVASAPSTEEAPAEPSPVQISTEPAKTEVAPSAAALPETAPTSEKVSAPRTDAQQRLKRLSASRLMRVFLEQGKPLESLLNAMDDVIQGTRPAASLDCFVPREKFTVSPSRVQPGVQVISEAAIRRFTPLVEAVTAIPPQDAVRCFRELREEFQVAFAAGGYSYTSLDAMVDRFLEVFMTMPDFNFNPSLKAMTNGNFMYTDQVFEELNDVQKLLVRLGFENLRKVKKWMALVRKELKTPESVK